MSVWLKVTFNDHVPLGVVEGMGGGLGAYGNISRSISERTKIVELYRPSRLAALKDQLTAWERYGFLRWAFIDRPKSD